MGKGFSLPHRDPKMFLGSFILGRNPYQYASRRNESPIAQSRWARWAIWRSSGFEFGTEFNASAGAENGRQCLCYVYVRTGVRVKRNAFVFVGGL
jgi:hypothetical protein